MKKSLLFVGFIFSSCFLLSVSEGLARNLLNPKPALAASNISFTELGSLVDSGAATLDSYFGSLGLRLGDINGDGYQDLLVSANNWTSVTGRLYTFFGGNTLNTTPGLVITGEATGNGIPAWLSDYGVGDLDKDNYSDIVGGAYNYSAGNGRAYIFFGSSSLTGNISASSANIKIDGDASNKKRMGGSSAMGDFNCDGNKDLAIAAYLAYSNQGAIYIYYGNGTKSIDTTPDKTLTVSGSTYLGIDSLKSGDINGDSCDDILVSEYPLIGKAYIFYGGNDMSTSYSVKFTAESGSDYLTYGNTDIKDINKDGYADVCMSAFLNSTVDVKTGRVYCFFGSPSFYGDKSVTTANVTISGSVANDDLGRSLSLYDVNNDGNLDLIAGAFQTYGSQNGYVNIYLGNGTTINTTPNITITAASIGESAKFFGVQVLGGDLDNDGWPDLFVGSAQGGNGTGTSGRVHVFEVNHGTPLISVSSSNYTNTSTPKISGTASDVNLNVSGVQWSLGSASTGTWTNCMADDGTFDSSSEKFSCSITSALSSGDHTIYLRSVDQNGLYMSSKLYGTANANYLSSGPATSWTTTSNEKKEFNLITPDHFYTTEELPTFKFNKADNSSGSINEYQIILTSNTYNDKVYLDGIIPDKPSDKNERDTDKMWVYYAGDSISVHGKKEEQKLIPGGYKWKVRVVDKAGNTKETETRILLVNSHIANFSNTHFPLTILSPTLNQLSNTMAVWSKAFSLYGITTAGTKVKLELATSDKTTGNNTIKFSRETTSNAESRYGINITKENNLSPGTYTATLTAINAQGDYQEQIFTLNYLKTSVLGNSVILSNAKDLATEGSDNKNTSLDLSASPQDDNNLQLDNSTINNTPTPTSSLPVKSGSNNKKTCFLIFCW